MAGTRGKTGDPGEVEFIEMMSRTLHDVCEGVLDQDEFVRMGRSRTDYSMRFCLKRLASPGLPVQEERLLASLLRQIDPVRYFLESLQGLDSEFPPSFALAFSMSDESIWNESTDDLPLKDELLLIRALNRIDELDPGAGRFPSLLVLLSLNAPGVQSKAAFLLESMDLDLVYTERLLLHPISRVRANVLHALVNRAEARALEHFRSCRDDPDNRVRSLSAVGLSLLGDPLAGRVLVEMTGDENAVKRRSGVWALSVCGGNQHLPLLEELIEKDPDERVRVLAMLARASILGRKSSPDSPPRHQERQDSD